MAFPEDYNVAIRDMYFKPICDYIECYCFLPVPRRDVSFSNRNHCIYKIPSFYQATSLLSRIPNVNHSNNSILPFPKVSPSMFSLYPMIAFIILVSLCSAFEGNLIIKKDYLRVCPLPCSGNAFECPQEGKCNNFQRRKHCAVPAFIMQHHTVLDYNGTVHAFTKIEKSGGKYLPGVSSHFVIDRDGTVQQTVALEYRAFHAGAGVLSKESKIVGIAAHRLSTMGVFFSHEVLQVGRGDMNSWSIGIENVNSGDQPFSKKQIKANILLCQYLCDKFPSLDPHLLIAHSDWTYQKIDPSPFFPWEDLARASELYPGEVRSNFGVYPRRGLELMVDPGVILSHDDHMNSAVPLDTVKTCQDLLRAFGYYIPEQETGKVRENTKGAIFAAHIRFQGPKIIKEPELYKAWHRLANDKDVRKSRAVLTVLDENLLIILTDCVSQLEAL